MKSIVLSGEKKRVGKHVLRRIVALRDIPNYKVRAGDLGGFIEYQENLSQEDDAWVADDACVYGNARVHEKAWVSGKAKVCEHAEVYGKAWVSGNARVSGVAKVYGEAYIYGDTNVTGAAKIHKKIRLQSGIHCGKIKQ